MKKKFASLTGIVLAVSILLSACRTTEEVHSVEPEAAPSTESLQEFTFPDFEPQWGTTAYPGEYSKGYDVVIDYAYSDRYFDFDSTLYNPSLATMSLCLELSSWSSYEVDAWPEKSHNARKLFEEIGFAGYAQNDFWKEKPSLQSIGAVAAHKQLGDCTLIALPVRGGNYYNEWGDNANLGADGYHAGFSEARDNILAFLEDYILDNDITGRVKLWVVGYSRGGAVANLVAGYLNQNPLPNGATLALEDLYCYTFEAPQGAMADAVGEDAQHCNIHNIVNANDIVPMVGPQNWDFARYNTTARLLPTVTTAQFESARNTMLEEFEEILAGATITKPEATAYRVSEYAKTLQVNFDPKNILPSGEPLLELQVVDDTRQTMNEVLSRFVSCLVDCIGGREAFYSDLQSDLVLLLELLKGYETGFDMDAVLDTVLTSMTANNYENLKYVLSPVFSMNGDTREERIDQVVERLHEVLPQPEGFADLYGTAGTLIQSIGKMLVNYPEEVMDIALAFTNSNVMQAHHQELTLAWVRSGDPHYTDTPWTMAVPEVLRAVQVDCPAGMPVNVKIYDAEGTLVASLTGDAVYRSSEVIGCARDEGGTVILHLPADEEYRIVTEVFEEGTANITLSEYNVAHSQVTREQRYAGVAAKAGSLLTLEVPNLVEEEFTDEPQQGSTAEYRLLYGTEDVPCQEQRGEEIDDAPVPRAYDIPAEEEEKSADAEKSAAAEESTPSGGTAAPEGGTASGGTTDPGTTTPPQTVSCPKCLQALPNGTDHAAACGTSDHYTCDGADHSPLNCGHYRCDGKTHDELPCGHYGCDTSATGMNHSIMPCGSHFYCDPTVSNLDSHVLCGHCGYLACNGDDHTTAECGLAGHYACDENSHGAAACKAAGHYACNGAHEPRACGLHHACDTAVEAAVCESVCGICSQPMCNGTNHDPAACGLHHVSDAGDHTSIRECGHPACADGEHGFYSCGTHRQCGEDGSELLCKFYCEVCREYWCVQMKIHDPNQCRLESNIQTP